MKVCTNCKESKLEVEFSFKNQDKGRRQSACKSCSRIYINEHYKNNRDYYLVKAKKRNLRIRNVIKSYIWDYLSTHACIDCGETDPIVLEFDHMSDKIAAVSEMHRNYSLETVKQEILKCEVRCANCHKRKTAKDRGWNKQFKLL